MVYFKRISSDGMARIFQKFLACLVMLAALLLPCMAYNCGSETPGVTIPRGDIYLESGQPLNVTCTLQKDAVNNETNAVSIFFTRDEEVIDSSFVAQLNDTSAELFIPSMNLTDDQNTFFCKLNSTTKAAEVVCLNKIVVGLAPQEVQNFTCVSKNWQSLTCTWDIAGHNIPTSYRIFWTLPGRYFSLNPAHCPTDSDLKYNNCTWTLYTVPTYRQPYEYYYFTFNASNKLANRTFQPIEFNHFEHIVPNAPTNLLVKNLTSHSMTLEWTDPWSLGTFPPGLTTRIRYRHEWMRKGDWVVNTLHDLAKPETLLHLPYANVNYTIQVQLKTARASDLRYSTPTTIYVKTPPKRPQPPEVDASSFETGELSSASLRHVYLYWKSVPEYMHGGQDFQYIIEYNDTNGIPQVLTLPDSTISSVTIREQSREKLTFKIYARNSMGQSDSASVITVPSYESQTCSEEGVYYMESGNDLNITCSLKGNRLHASDIIFTKDGEIVPSKYVTVVNATTAKLLIPGIKLMRQSLYPCDIFNTKMAVKQHICHDVVTVGLKPQEVVNFTCISDDWRSLTCKWDTVDHYIPTTYKVSWKALLSQKEEIMIGPFKCPSDSDEKHSNCTWDVNTNPAYKPEKDFYYFTIQGSNKLGYVVFPPIRFHHFANVKLRPSRRLRASDVTSNSMLLNWEEEEPTHYPTDLVYRVKYRHKWKAENAWVVMTDLKTSNLFVPNMPYAYVNYTVQLEAKSIAATSDLMFSEPTTLIVTTKPKIPSTSITMNRGGYETSSLDNASLRDITIYWQRVPEYLYNGDDFGFYIFIYDDISMINSIVVNDSTAFGVRIKGICTEIAYRFLVQAKNSVGVSKSGSFLNVPSFKSRLHEPLLVTNIYDETRGYELSWVNPNTSALIYDRVIFNCPSVQDKPHQCLGPLNWKHVTGNDTLYIDQTASTGREHRQFAISVGVERMSSGMSWTTCTLVGGKIYARVRGVIIRKATGSNKRFRITFVLECTRRVKLVPGFVLKIKKVVIRRNV